MKSRVKTRQVRGIWSQRLEYKQVPKRGTEPGLRKGKRSLLAYHTRCKCSIETTHNLVKVKLGIKVMKLVEILIGWEVIIGQGSECHLTFVRGGLHNNFLNDDFKRSTRYPCSSSLLESRLALRIKHSYEEQARAYRIS